MRVTLEVKKQIYQRNERGHYMDFVCRDSAITELEYGVVYTPNKPVYPSLKDGVLSVKIPWKYNRPMVKSHNMFNTIFDFKEGDSMTFEVKFMGKWETEWGNGTSWKMVSIH